MLLSTGLSQIEALELLFNSTRGDQWRWRNEATSGPKWSFSSPQADPCNDKGRVWQGITCSSAPNICKLQSCEIVSLDLNAYNLKGTLPSQFFVQLFSLKKFEISASVGLVGSIPSEIGFLSQLSHLSINLNQLSGSIPSEISSLSRLSVLYLDNNQLTGAIPSEVGSLIQLNAILLYSNQLTGAIPSEIGSLSRLESLSLDNNRLTGVIPSEIWSLSLLHGLSLDNNQLTGAISSQIGSLSLLSYLYLYINQLTGTIPSEIGSLSLLGFLSLDNNHLTGVISSAIGSLSQLGTLELEYNQLSGSIPSQIGSLSRLSYLSLDGNHLSGAIPSQIGSLSQLTVLFLAVNQLSKTIPSSIGSLSRLDTVSLGGNQLTGAIPPQIGSLSLLGGLYLGENRLSGRIPYEIGSLARVGYLAFSENQLSGSIPSEIGSLSRLVALYLYTNELTGAIPSTVGSMSRLGVFALDDNLLTGTIPSDIGTLSQLGYLSVYNNHLNGTIPTEIGSLSRLGYIYLNINHLTGVIPSDIGSLSLLGGLYLDNNQLTGAIPSEIGSLSQLGYLYLYENQLSKVIPTEIGYLSQLSYLSLHSNLLTGVIPSSISNLSSLIDLHLHHNQLAGSISFPLTSFPRLQQLFLHHNSFTGRLNDLFLSPSPNSSQLLNLDVSDNLLSGSIPSTLFLLSSLQSISLSLNCFEDELPLAMCDATGVTVISMDGLGSAEGCKNVVTLPFPFTSVSLVQSMDGSIPNCVWSMSNLKILNLAGNGLRGRIGSVSSMSSLWSLTLSHNHLSGEIPLWLQEKSMLHLDLSHNKLTGGADGFKYQEAFNSSSVTFQWGNQSSNKNLTLIVNRLSGELPSSFGKYAHLDILSGNLFGCDHLPENDKNSESLTCGSEQYDQSMITMGGSLGMVICLVAVYRLLSLSRSSFRVGDNKTKDDRWWFVLLNFRFLLGNPSQLSPEKFHRERNSALPDPLSSKIAFESLLAQMMWSACVLAALCLLLTLPVFVLKQLDVGSANGATQYATHTHMYNWLWTMAFVSGTTPAIILLVACVVCLFYFKMVLNRLGGSREPISAVLKSDTDGQGHIARVTAVWFLVFVNIAVVGTVNGLYIWSTLLDLARDIRLSVQLSFALFSSLWIVVLRRSLPSQINESRHGVWLFICLNAMNSVLIPCAVTALSTPSCYQVSVPFLEILCLIVCRDWSCLLMSSLPPTPINIVLSLLFILMAAQNVSAMPPPSWMC
jgi:Leucine-rich repeat (LRR) protein